MPAIALTAETAVTPVERIENAVVVLRDGRVEAIGTRAAVTIPADAQVRDFGSSIIAPGFLDLHIHGAGGHDVMEGSPAALACVEQALAGFGTTAYLPTTVTAPLDLTLHALERLAAEIERWAPQPGKGPRARPVGIHLEGPFLSHVRRGVHPPEHLMGPSVALFDQLWQAARGHVRMMTIAPELPGALEVIAAATARGVCCSLGHTDADTEAARAGVQAGARHATHTFNAMRPLNHRDPGVLGVALTDPALTADVIVDGVHLDPAIVELFLKAKGHDRAVLITDGISATGMGDGNFRLGAMDVEVRGPRCTHNGVLAGSVLTLDLAMRNVMQFAGCSLQQALRLVTVNPASVIKRNETQRGLVAGAPAEIVILTLAGEVMETICGGC